MSKYGAILILLIVGIVVLFGLLIAMYYESEIEKKNLIIHYEDKIKNMNTTKSNNKSDDKPVFFGKKK